MCKEHVDTSVVGNVLMAGHVPTSSIFVSSVRIAPSGRGVDAAGERHADLVGPAPERQGNPESGSR